MKSVPLHAKDMRLQRATCCGLTVTDTVRAIPPSQFLDLQAPNISKCGPCIEAARVRRRTRGELAAAIVGPMVAGLLLALAVLLFIRGGGCC